jgi:uncharacterized protein (TIGR03435 family)
MTWLWPGAVRSCNCSMEAALPFRTLRKRRMFRIRRTVSIAGELRGFSGRPVINKTGITGEFDIHLEFTADKNTDAPNAGASIFTAVEEQPGLKLVPGRGPAEFLIIDHVERPSGN